MTEQAKSKRVAGPASQSGKRLREQAWSLTLAASLLLGAGCTSLKSAADEVRPQQDDDSAIEAPAPDAETQEEAPLLEAEAGSSDNDAGSAESADAGVDGAVEGGASADAGPLSCVDAKGFQGLGCYRCVASDIITLENACADVSCRPFADALRLPRLLADGGLPDLPSEVKPDAGVVAPGTPDTSRPCSEATSAGKSIYVTGSSAVRPFLEQIARQFVTRGVYVVYTSTGSCIGVDAILNGTTMTTGIAPAPAAYALYWSTALSEGERCQLPAQGVRADLGISDVFVQSCPGFEIADINAKQVRDANGPIQTMAFVVPANSSQTELSAQAAYLVYGFGKDAGVRDLRGEANLWSDETRILQRQGSSGTQALLAAAIGVPAGRWKGKTHRTSDELVASLLSAASDMGVAEQTLGILGADYIDSKNLRAQVRVLAFRDTHQTCAVYPDSTETAHDRQNVRDGHYPLWGPLHLLHSVNEDGLPAKLETRQEVSDAIGYLSGSKPLPNGVKLIDVYAQSGLIPECAMRVTRAMDGGNITPKRPESPCACLFEARATGSTKCSMCKVQGDCASGQTCSHGYCEP